MTQQRLVVKNVAPGTTERVTLTVDDVKWLRSKPNNLCLCDTCLESSDYSPGAKLPSSFLTSIADTITSCITDVLHKTLNDLFPTVLTDHMKTAMTESFPSYLDALVKSRNIKLENEFQFVITGVTENGHTHAGKVDTDSGAIEEISEHIWLKNNRNIRHIRRLGKSLPTMS